MVLIKWGGRATDYNGQTVEEVLELNGLVCFNNGQGTKNGVESAIDLNLVSSEITWCQ